MGRTGRLWLQTTAAVVLLALVVVRVGGEPFLAGLRAVRPDALLAVAGLTGLTTLAAAWRWQAVARCLGDSLPLPVAIGAYYRSQFLNSVLPGGVVGDVHRALARGRSSGGVTLGLRSVGWERAAGQAVQVAVAAVVLVTVRPAPAEATVVLLAATGLVLVGLGVLGLLRSRTPPAGPAHVAAAAPLVVLASVGTTAGHSAAFLIAAKVVGVRASLPALLPLVLLVLIATALPLSVAGWGLREGAAAWLFGAAGLGPEVGVAAATAYGTMALVAVLPGGVLLLLDRLRHPGRIEGA